jgi:hypothetical protein
MTRFAVLVAAMLAGTAPAQAPARELPPSTPQEFVIGQPTQRDSDSLFSINRSQEDIHEFEVACAELAGSDFKAAVDRLHRLLQHESGGVLPIGPGRFWGLRLAVVLRLANLPPAAVTEYEQLVQREAGTLATKPLATLRADQLLMLAERFPTSAIGRGARLRLGDLAL